MLRSFPDIVAEASAGLRCLDAASAAAEHAENKGVLVDVREPGETSQKAAVGSHAIPRGVLELQITNIAPAHDHPIYLHCASGGRARMAAEQLQRMGYTRVTAITCALDQVCEAFGDG